MLEQLLSSDRSQIIGTLTGTLGLSQEQADGFFAKAIALIEGAVRSGKLDLNALISSAAGDLASKLDLEDLAGFVGGDQAKAREGVTVIIQPLAAKLSVDPAAAQILGQLGTGGVVETVTRGVQKIFGGS